MLNFFLFSTVIPFFLGIPYSLSFGVYETSVGTFVVKVCMWPDFAFKSSGICTKNWSLFSTSREAIHELEMGHPRQLVVLLRVSEATPLHSVDGDHGFLDSGTHNLILGKNKVSLIYSLLLYKFSHKFWCLFPQALYKAEERSARLKNHGGTTSHHRE